MLFVNAHLITVRSGRKIGSLLNIVASDVDKIKPK